MKFRACAVASKILFMIIIFEVEIAHAQSRFLDEDAAIVCLDIGVRAAITGLEDIELSLTRNQERRDGDKGAQYIGFDSFFLESNAPVRVLISAAPLSNGLDVLSTSYEIDNSVNTFESKSNQGHAQEHQLKVRAQLGEISSQLAGEYSSTLVLTVIPQITSRPKCQPGAASPEVNPIEATIDAEIDFVPANGSKIDEGSAALERQVFEQEVYASIPAQFIELMNMPNSEMAFPLLEEFRLWSIGVTPTLSEPARYWWMFPSDESVLTELIER